MNMHAQRVYQIFNSSIRLIRRCIGSRGRVEDTRRNTDVKEEARNELVVRVAVIGLPNCGKSTLVNQLMKQKVTIVVMCVT